MDPVHSPLTLVATVTVKFLERPDESRKDGLATVMPLISTKQRCYEWPSLPHNYILAIILVLYRSQNVFKSAQREPRPSQ